MYDDFFDDPESELENENNSVLNDKDENLMKEEYVHTFFNFLWVIFYVILFMYMFLIFIIIELLKNIYFNFVVM